MVLWLGIFQLKNDVNWTNAVSVEKRDPLSIFHILTLLFPSFQYFALRNIPLRTFLEQ